MINTKVIIRAIELWLQLHDEHKKQCCPFEAIVYCHRGGYSICKEIFPRLRRNHLKKSKCPCANFNLDFVVKGAKDYLKNLEEESKRADNPL